MSNTDEHEPPPEATAWLARDSWARATRLRRDHDQLTAIVIGGDGRNGLRADVVELKAKVASLEALRFKVLGAVAVIAGVSATIGAVLAQRLLGGS